MKKREIDLSTQEHKRAFFNILDGFKTKKEAYSYIGVSPNNYGIKALQKLANAVGFDLNVYAERRKTKSKICVHCGKEFIPKTSCQKFCSSSCAASYNNSRRPPHSEESKKKVSESLHKHYGTKPHKDRNYRTILRKRVRVTPKTCPVCGREHCEKDGICRFTKQLFKNLTYFGFDESCLGTSLVFNEYERIKKLLEYEYYTNHLSSSDLKSKYGYPKTFENITHVLKTIGINTRNHSTCQQNAILMGKLTLPTSEHDVKLGFKQGWHTTWDGQRIFYRSGAELKYAELLDESMISYKVEGLRIEYYDSVKKCVRVAIPDFLLCESNEIVEVKSRVTFVKQNMIDKFNAYKKLGYKPKLLYEGVMYNEFEIDTIQEHSFILEQE